MDRLAIVAFLAFPLAIYAEDARKTELRSILLPMRADPAVPLPARGATPQFTVIKHTLRDWIESRLALVPTREATHAVEDQLNAELLAEKLVCKIDYGTNDIPCPEMTARGYLSPIKVRLSNFTLVVQTGVGIQNCGFDESAYAYEWSEKAWRRFWQSEQNDYVDERYRPQSLIDVLVSSNDEKSGEHLILTLGIHSWCTSNFQGVYYRVWQTRSIASPPRLLLDETGPAMLRFWPPIKGRLATLDDRIGAADDVLVEYTVFGHANGIMDREEVRHYRLRQDRLERVDPIALSPANFVDVWLAMDGPARSGWTDPQTRERLRHWRSSAVPDGSERFGQASHCEQKPDAWQEVFFGDSIGKAAATYFLVRWRPPFHFTMLDISDHPFPGCTEKDPEADQFRSLFR